MNTSTHTIPGAASPPRAKPQTTGFRLHMAFIALVSAGAGAFLALHYPVAPLAVALAFAAACAVFLRWPDTWLLAIPAVLPLIGFAPWTGWITFEELDLLVLAAAAGGYARAALPGVPLAPKGKRVHYISPGSLLLVVLFAASTLVAMARGFADAGGFVFGWYQGYHEPMNSVRLAKSFFLALLVLPLWWGAVARRGAQASTWLATGVSLGLAAAAMTTLWERTAFTGLFNFSSDYRTTGLFWEMHVGGAALDGFLTLCVPFAVRELFFARSTPRWGTAVACLALAAYACLTTFSRGVYLAVPVAVVVTIACCLLVTRRQARAAARTGALPASVLDKPKPGGHALLPGIVLVAIYSAAIWFVFPSSGYRGLLALLGAMFIAMPLARVLRSLRPVDWVLAVLAGCLLSAAVWSVAAVVPKGAYFGYALAVAFSICMLFLWQTSAEETKAAPAHGRRRPRPTAGLPAQLALSGYMAVLTGTLLVADHWAAAAGALASMAAAAAAFFVVSLVSGTAKRALWPDDYRWQATTLAAMVLVGGTLGVFGGGAYMTGRFSTSESDLDGRIQHWREGWGMLTTPGDQLLGKGLGRYPASHFFAGSSIEHPGDYRLKEEPGNTFLTLGGGKQRYMGWGELLRVSQRMPAPRGPVTARLVARAAEPVHLHLEICEKHLLYNAGCLVGNGTVPAKPGGSRTANDWQELKFMLPGDPIGGGPWYAPKLVTFSIATDTAQGVVDIDKIELISADGKSLVDNGDFSQGMQRWFFSSDRNHMPWHIKSVLMNVLFDQGLVGLGLFLLMGIAALWRVVLGSAKDHPLGPAIAGGLVGFVVVGLFDSLVDVPRLAFIFYLVLLLGLTVRQPKASRVTPPERGHAPAHAQRSHH